MAVGTIRPVKSDESSVGRVKQPVPAAFAQESAPRQIPPELAHLVNPAKEQTVEQGLEPKVVPQPVQPVVRERPRNIQVANLTQVPSKFVGYGDLDVIEIRPLTLGELKYMSSGLTDQQVIEAFRPAILNIDVEDLTFSDFLFISSHINIITSGDQNWTMNITCRECGEKFEYNTERDGFFMFEELKVPELPVVIELDGQELHFDLPRVRDTKMAKLLKKNYPKSSDELLGLAAQVRNMQPVKALKILEGVTDAEEIALVDEVQELLYHGELPLSAVCPKCGFEGKYRVGSGVSTIKPFRESGKSVNGRIKYGVGN